MAVAGSSAVQMVLLFVGLKLRLGTIRAHELGSSAARVALASLVAGASAWGAARLLSGAGQGAIARALPGLGGVVVFGAVYLVVVWGLGAREVSELAGPVRRRLARRR
jgi:peptidoglycan biosynthesis protein MviN/MurJ (putative lipid II flippase)